MQFGELLAVFFPPENHIKHINGLMGNKQSSGH